MNTIAQSRNTRKRQRSRPSCKEQHLQCVTEKRVRHPFQSLYDGCHVCEVFNPPLSLQNTFPIAVHILDSICVVPDAVHAMILTHHGCFGRYTQLRTTEKLLSPSSLPQLQPNTDVPAFVLAHEEVLYLMEKLHVIRLFRVEDLDGLCSFDVSSTPFTTEEFRSLASAYNPRFQDIYKTYFTLRGLGYTPKSALRYGSDLLLYDGSPMSTHSKYCVYVSSTDVDTIWPYDISASAVGSITSTSTTTSRISTVCTTPPMSTSFSATSLLDPPNHFSASHPHFTAAEGLSSGLMMGLDTCLHTRIARFAHKQTLYVTVVPPQPSTDFDTLRTMSDTHAGTRPNVCANIGDSDVATKKNEVCRAATGGIGSGSVDKARKVPANYAGVDVAEYVEETRVAGGHPQAAGIGTRALDGQFCAMEGCVQDDDMSWAVYVAGDAEVERWERVMTDRTSVRARGARDAGIEMKGRSDNTSKTMAGGGVAKAVDKADEGESDCVTIRQRWEWNERKGEMCVERRGTEGEADADSDNRSNDNAVCHRGGQGGEDSVGNKHDACGGHICVPVTGIYSCATDTLLTEARTLGLDTRGCILYMQTVTPWRASHEATRKINVEGPTRAHVAK